MAGGIGNGASGVTLTPCRSPHSPVTAPVLETAGSRCLPPSNPRGSRCLRDGASVEQAVSKGVGSGRETRPRGPFQVPAKSIRGCLTRPRSAFTQPASGRGVRLMRARTVPHRLPVPRATDSLPIPPARRWQTSGDLGARSARDLPAESRAPGRSTTPRSRFDAGWPWFRRLALRPPMSHFPPPTRAVWRRASPPAAILPQRGRRPERCPKGASWKLGEICGGSRRKIEKNRHSGRRIVALLPNRTILTIPRAKIQRNPQKLLRFHRNPPAPQPSQTGGPAPPSPHTEDPSNLNGNLIFRKRPKRSATRS